MTNKRIFSQHVVSAAALLTGIASAGLPVVGRAAADVALASAATNDAIGRRLIAEERASWDLAIKHDVSAYKAFHAPDFFTLNDTGVVGKAPSETSALDPLTRFDQCELSGFDVHVVASNAVLITYHLKAAGLDHGKTFQLDSYASSLWMKRDGKWINVFYQATPASAT